MQPTGQNLADLLSVELAVLPTLDARVRRVSAAFPDGRVAFSTSLGMEDQVILEAIASAKAGFDVFTLDTGRHFPETLETLDESIRRYNVPIRVIAPDATEVEHLVARDGVFGFRVEIERRKACCDIRKVRPLGRALAGAAAWITGLRRSQSGGRADVPFAAFDPVTKLIKLNPIADWTLDQVEAAVKEKSIPINPLHGKGFPSIGCQPCTRAIEPGEDIRAGRWWWENEMGKECGLHNRPVPQKTAAPKKEEARA